MRRRRKGENNIKVCLIGSRACGCHCGGGGGGGCYYMVIQGYYLYATVPPLDDYTTTTTTPLSPHLTHLSFLMLLSPRGGR